MTEPDDRCHGCNTRRAVFRDGRTSNSFCHECCAALISYELDAGADGQRDDPDLPYREWLDAGTAPAARADEGPTS